ncbi:4'-phosphopantetheinyl transferase family protein [Paenarthrobacter sp. NPDC056912]|uniref:4'-phosphopantetheinyl transferase family protein n=1 Tax=Paenarthrobacter sp. NPDC056912 TaxID=3345965 RepID=UPI003670F8C6
MNSAGYELLKLADVPVSGPSHLDLDWPAQLRATRFTHPKDREEFIAGRLAALHFAASLLDVDSARLSPDYRCPQCGPGQDHGRPGFLLDGGRAPLVLSASRASGWVLLAGVVSPRPGLRLGVDLEATNRTGFEGFDDVALTEGEKRFLASVAEEQQAVHRTRLWARKEAWLKMTGEGLRRNPADVDVLDLPGLSDVTSIDENRKLPDGLVAALASG